MQQKVLKLEHMIVSNSIFPGKIETFFQFQTIKAFTGQDTIMPKKFLPDI